MFGGMAEKGLRCIIKSHVLAVLFGLIGMGLGPAAASGSGMTSVQPLWLLSGGAWLAILGAVLGGTADIVQAITDAQPR